MCARLTHSRLHALETCVYACDTAVCSNGLHRSPGSELLVCDSYCCVWCRVVSAIFEWKDSVTMPQRCARACSQPMPLVTRVCAHMCSRVCTCVCRCSSVHTCVHRVPRHVLPAYTKLYIVYSSVRVCVLGVPLICACVFQVRTHATGVLHVNA